MRPPIGARTRVNSTFNAATRSAARATIRAASASFFACVRRSNSSWLMPRIANSASPRVKSVDGEFHASLRAHDVGPSAFEGCFVRSRIDHEQQLTGFDDRAVAEMDGVEIPVDASANVNAIGRLEAAGVLVPFGQPQHQAVARRRPRAAPQPAVRPLSDIRRARRMRVRGATPNGVSSRPPRRGSNQRPDVGSIRLRYRRQDCRIPDSRLVARAELHSAHPGLTVRVELEHPLVELLSRCGGFHYAVEIPDVLPGLFDDPGIVVVFRPLV